MKKASWRKPLFGCLFLLLAVSVTFGQVVWEFSLDDNPTPGPGPYGPGAPPVPPFESAEDELGVGFPFINFRGPSPSLLIFNYFDSDILFAGPGLSQRFAPPPPAPNAPSYVDAHSSNHYPKITQHEFHDIWLLFSVDRQTGGLQPADASWQQAAVPYDQPGDVYQSSQFFQHPGFFIPLPNPGWIFGGPLMPPAGTGAGFPNVMYIDQAMLGLVAGPNMFRGSHDNVDSFNEFPGPMIQYGTYYALHPASAQLLGFSPADIFYSPVGAYTYMPPPYAWAWQLGLDTFGPNTDSVDALIIWDTGMQGVCEPGRDYALFSLAPGSATLAAIGLPETAASVFITDFQGWFYTYVWNTDIGVGPLPVPPLPGILDENVNVDALEVTPDWPVSDPPVVEK